MDAAQDTNDPLSKSLPVADEAVGDAPLPPPLHPFEPNVNLPEPPSAPPEPGFVAESPSDPPESEKPLPPLPPPPEPEIPVPPPPIVEEPAEVVLEDRPKQGIKLNNKIIAGLVILLIAVLAGGAIFAVNAFVVPTKIKEKVELTQPIFEEYSKVVGEIGDDLKEENPTASDSESIERAKQKSDGLLKSESEIAARLSPAVEKLNLKQLAQYRSNIESYQSKAKELVVLERDSVSFAAAYVDSIREYEKLVVDISGTNNYILSDPDKYVAGMNEVVTKYKSILENLKKGQLQGEMENLSQAVIRRMEEELSFIEKIKSGVEARDAASITEAEQKWTQSEQDSTKNINRIADRLKEVVRGAVGEINSLKSKVDGEYGQLRSRYKF